MHRNDHVYPLVGEGDFGIVVRDYLASQIDVSVYDPVATYERSHGRTPTVTELAEYIADIRYIEADAIIERSHK